MLSSDKIAASDFLKAAGFSAAWVLTNTDRVEAVFLVPREELVTSDLDSQTLELMSILPGRKVYIAPYRIGLPVDRLY
jgi:hypothetical protein